MIGFKPREFDNLTLRELFLCFEAKTEMLNATESTGTQVLQSGKVDPRTMPILSPEEHKAIWESKPTGKTAFDYTMRNLARNTEKIVRKRKDV